MFTFGRDHEKKCAVQDVRKPEDSDRITAVVDAVHDLIEGKVASDAVRPILTDAFSSGGSRVWERTGSWLRQLSVMYPDLISLWRELSQHANGNVRFRVACFLDDMPKQLALELGNRLKEDRHQKTREMAQARLEELQS